MSDLNLLENMVAKRANYVQQRDLVQNNLQQLLGAIYACDVLIKEHEDNLKDKLKDEDKEHVEVNHEDAEQVA